MNSQRLFSISNSLADELQTVNLLRLMSASSSQLQEAINSPSESTQRAVQSTREDLSTKLREATSNSMSPVKMETMRPPGFPGNPPARMPRAPTPARSPPPRPLRGGDVAFRPTHDVGPRDQCISGLNHAAHALPVNASRPGSPQAHASLGSGWWPTLAGWGWIPTGYRTRFRRSHHGILSPLTGLSRHTRWRTESRIRSRRPTPARTCSSGGGG